MILDKLSQYIPGSSNYGHHEMNIDPITALSLAKAGAEAISGIVGGIVGSRARKREQQSAQIEQRERLYDYENFDYNQDVGYINDPYAKLANQTQEYESEQIDKTLANASYVQRQSGQFGNTTALVNQGTAASQKSAQRVNQLRAAGSQYVENIRQQRIEQEFGIAETTLGRSDARLAAANQARAKATNSLVGGLAGGAALGAAGGLGGFKGGGGGSASTNSKFTTISNTSQNTSNNLISENPQRFNTRPDGSVVDLQEYFKVDQDNPLFSSPTIPQIKY